MRERSSLSAGQREELVALFEQGCSYWAAAHHVGVGVYPVRALFRRFLLHSSSTPSRSKRKLSNAI